MTYAQLAAFVPGLIRWEGAVPWMYRDSLGYCTVAIGNLVHNATDAAALAFIVANESGRPATKAEVTADFSRVMGLAKAMPAKEYRAPSGPRVELADNSVTDLTIGRLRDEFIPGIVKLCPAFESFPFPAQQALLDISWNAGLHGLESFGHMLAAVDRRDWAAAAASCHRKTSREERNQWTSERFLSAQG